MYVTTAIMDALEQSTEFTRKIELTQIAEGGIGIETRVTDIDGVPVMEVIDDERFYDAFNWEPEAGGFEPKKKSSSPAVTGAHKINNVLGQALLAKKMGKTRLIAETGAGQHGVATATAAALLGMECVVFMGEEDTIRQALNVYRMRLLGAEVIPVRTGTAT